MEKTKKQSAFTLIELLVVISIIALLLSIMLPALKRAKEQALSMICKTRLKDMGVATNLYVMANDGLLMASWPVGDEQVTTGVLSESFKWPARLAPYYDREKGGKSFGYYDYKLWRCPTMDKYTKTAAEQSSDISKHIVSGDVIGAKGLYGYNLYFSQAKSDAGALFPEYQWKRIADISSTGTLPLLGDTSCEDYLNLGYLDGGQHIRPEFPHPSALKYGWNEGRSVPRLYDSFGAAPNHRGKINFLMADFHVDAVGLFDWTYPGKDNFAPNFWKPYFHPKRNPAIMPR